MTSIGSRMRRLPLVLCLLISFSWVGCGPAVDPTAPPPIQEDEKGKLTAALPPGVTLESPIEPNVMLGANSKTVGEALASLHAYVKNGKIYDGGMSSVIEFKTGKDAPKPKPARGSKTKEETTTIVLSGG